MTAANTSQHFNHLVSEMLECMKEYIETLEGFLPECVDVLDTYVNGRMMPTPLTTEDSYTEICNAIMFIGSALELKPKEGESRYNDDFLPPWAYKNENPLQELINKAERYLSLDFGRSYYRDATTREPIDAFTLEDLAAVSGQKIGSIRNAAAASGDLKTIKVEQIVDKEGNRISQKVLVEYQTALEWLQEKNLYKPLRTENEQEEANSKEMLIQKIVEYGPRFNGKNLPDFLKLSEKGDLVTYYAPFEYVNTGAKVVLCGITPGAQQAEIALNTFALALREGKSQEDALRLAKSSASFAGPMRTSLVKMLDHVSLHEALGITSCESLFSSHSHLVHYTSALRNPVFFRGQNYTGNPLMLKELTLRHQIDTSLSDEVSMLGQNVLYIPLGPKPAAALISLADSGLLDRAQILDGIPHPSGANAERIKYFCEEKAREDLSSKTNAEALDAARSSVMQKIKTYASHH